MSQHPHIYRVFSTSHFHSDVHETFSSNLCLSISIILSFAYTLLQPKKNKVILRELQ